LGSRICPSAVQKELAHRLIDEGVDLVIGTGPHVIQPAEVYKNRPIVYSLGNFLFDMTDSKETATGMIVAGKFTDTAILLQPMLTENVQLQPVLLRSKATDEKLKDYFTDITQYTTNEKGGIQFTISK
jgi:poly-gamma-glutamate capsule biosynthesis protein CapA/YwtB (metallophosphatase superfamily)